MSYSVEVGDINNRTDLFELVLKEKLYVKSYGQNSGLRRSTEWALNSKTKFFTWTSKGEKHKRAQSIIAIAYEIDGNQKRPVGCMVVYGFYINFYVKKNSRNNGLARMMFNEACLHYPLQTKICCYGDIPNSARAFYTKMGIATNFKEYSKRDYFIPIVQKDKT